MKLHVDGWCCCCAPAQLVLVLAVTGGVLLLRASADCDELRADEWPTSIEPRCLFDGAGRPGVPHCTVAPPPRNSD